MNESVLGREHNAALEKRDGEAVDDHSKCTQTATSRHHKLRKENLKFYFWKINNCFNYMIRVIAFFSQEIRESIDIKVIIYL